MDGIRLETEIFFSLIYLPSLSMHIAVSHKYEWDWGGNMHPFLTPIAFHDMITQRVPDI